jgi:hypothetical protein
MTMQTTTTEKAREARLRRIARKDGRLFQKRRSWYDYHGRRVWYELSRDNNLIDGFETLEQAESFFE